MPTSPPPHHDDRAGEPGVGGTMVDLDNVAGPSGRPTAPPSTPVPARGRDRIAGIVAVAVALATGELFAGLFADAPSLVVAVGSALIPIFPPAVVEGAKSVFGFGDKAALAIGTVLIALLVGAFVGTQARRRRANGITIFVVFGVLGLVTGLAQPLIDPVLTTLSAFLATAAGVGVLLRLLATPAPRRGAAFGDAAARQVGDDASRRHFLVAAGGFAALAMAAASVGRWLQLGRTTVDVAEVAVPTPARSIAPPLQASSFDLEGLTPIVIPNEDFYRIDTALSIPRIDPATWSLRIHGMVDQEVSFTFDELRAMPSVEAYVTLSCVSNEVGGDLVGNAKWLGIPLADLLDRAGVQPGATQIVGRSVDGFTAGFPTEIAFDGRDALLALGMNGEALPLEHGFPARLVIPGLYGYVSATKWLSDIELTTLEDFDGFWIPRGWSKDGPVKTQSRIDVPRRGITVPDGEVVIAGVAWAPHRGIDKVEVQVSDQQADGVWQEAELSTPLSEDAWVQWRIAVDVGPGDHLVMVRATDGLGRTQTERSAPPAPDGATGYDSAWIRVAGA